jgi:predicted RNase H-like HicB family nuclease
VSEYKITICWSNEDQVFLAEVPELPGCITHGSSRAEALASAEEAIQLWLDTAEEFGNPVPQPKARLLRLA